MRELTKFLCLVLPLALCCLCPPPALAGPAPPRTALGEGIEPNGASTRVKMVSEEVVLEIEPLSVTTHTRAARDTMVAHVAADLLMLNQGAEEESLDVRFPLAAGGGSDDAAPIDTFQAWVDGESASVEEVTAPDPVTSDQERAWATWSVVFPPGETVQVRVAYDVYPSGDYPWGVFSYPVESGADWYGPIGEGTVIFRLPYEVDARNVELTAAQMQFAGPDGSYDTVEAVGREVIWRFTDLEPEPKTPCNATLAVLTPQVWSELVATEEEAAAHPEDLDVHLAMARAARSALRWEIGPLATEPNIELSADVDRAYARALELAPENPEVAIAYLEWEARLFYSPDLAREVIRLPSGGMVPAMVLPALAHAQTLAPGDPRVVAVFDWLMEIGVVDEDAQDDALTDVPGPGDVSASGDAATAPGTDEVAHPADAPSAGEDPATTDAGPNATPDGGVIAMPRTIEALDRSVLGFIIGIILLGFVALSLQAFER